jgi:hypothetical protein
MRTHRTSYGCICASDRRLQFHAVSGRYRWEVRRNGRRGGHRFRTLHEAKAWARWFWRPWFATPWLGSYLLQEALRGDEVAWYAFLDQLEETGNLRGFRRDELNRYARQSGLIGHCHSHSA